MWPILITSIVALTVVIERLLFLTRESFTRRRATVSEILARIEHGDVEGAIRAGEGSPDYVARTLTYGLLHRDKSASDALLRAANREMKRFSRGLTCLDTIITLAPLLGLLGTVTGMIRSFGLVGGDELGAPTAITGGIAEALIATAFGLGVAIVALIPYNYLHGRMEAARTELQDAASHVELWLKSSAKEAA